MGRRTFRDAETFEQGSGGQRPIPSARHPRGARPRQFRRTGGDDLHLHYREADRYRDKRVLVAGCAVSSLEIAAELAQSGAARVVVTQRRQRYVLPKFAAGVPSDHRIFTRYGVVADESLPKAEIDRQLREIVVDAGGSPEQYGAPAPDLRSSPPASPSASSIRWSPRAGSPSAPGSLRYPVGT